MTGANAKVREWGERFRKAPLAARCVADLHQRSGEIWQRTFELLRSESPEYRNSVDEEFTKESKSHCTELLNTIIAVAAGRAEKPAADPFDFVRTHAEWRSQHQVPLIASLHAYRLAHKTYWEITRESLMRHAGRKQAIHALTMLSDFWIEFFDYVGAILAESHAFEESLTLAQSTRAYVGLIDDLLRGVGPASAEARRLATLCGIRPGAPIAVAVARPFPSGERKQIDLEVTLRSLVRLIQQVFPAATFGKLVDIRNGEVMVILSSAADPSRALLRVLRDRGFGRRRTANGLSAGVGVSLDTLEITRLPEALEEARLALEFATTAQPLLHFADIDLPEFLIRRADRAVFRLVPEWTGPLTADDELARTVRAFADCSLNVKQTAQRLGVHTNTVYFRLNRISKLTGIDARSFAGASLLLTALRLVETRTAATKL